MDDLVDRFGGKSNGELIKTSDWNGLVEAIETGFKDLQADIDVRFGEVGDRLDAVEGRLDTAEGGIAELNGLAEIVRTRYRRLELSSTRTRFAIGERGEIIARVTNFDGSSLNIPNVADRPWVDFITVWGSLKAVQGFTSRGGASNRTVSVRVDAQGEARVLLRADHAEAFPEEQEQEIEAVLTTEVSPNTTAAQAVLAANTPNDTDLAPVWQLATNAYAAPTTPVAQNYLDSYYVYNPQQSFGFLTSLFAFQWRDHHATVMAFVKPDEEPTTADGAMATGSIQITFRDWIYPWIFTQFITPPVDLVGIYQNGFIATLGDDYQAAIDDSYTFLAERQSGTGILGQLREIAAAEQALVLLGPDVDPPPYFSGYQSNLLGGFAVQKPLIFSQGYTPGADNGNVAPGKQVTNAGVSSETIADDRATTVRNETDAAIRAAEERIGESVLAQGNDLRNEIFSDDGAVRQTQLEIERLGGEVIGLRGDVQNKADLSTVIASLPTRG